MSATADKPVSTLYWDDKASGFVHILWTGTFAKHTKVPKSIHTAEDAAVWVEEQKLA